MAVEEVPTDRCLTLREPGIEHRQTAWTQLAAATRHDSGVCVGVLVWNNPGSDYTREPGAGRLAIWGSLASPPTDPGRSGTEPPGGDAWRAREYLATGTDNGRHHILPLCTRPVSEDGLTVNFGLARITAECGRT